MQLAKTGLLSDVWLTLNLWILEILLVFLSLFPTLTCTAVGEVTLCASIAVSQTLLLISCDSGTYLYDISSPETPQFVGTYGGWSNALLAPMMDDDAVLVAKDTAITKVKEYAVTAIACEFSAVPI